MSRTLRIAIGQINCTVGAIDENVEKILKTVETARDKHQADVLVLPELALCGYPAEDLLLRKHFIQSCEEALRQLKKEIKDIYCLVGHPHLQNGKLYNACSLIHAGNIVATYHKRHLPNYGVFDEQRYFTAGTSPCVVDIKGVSVGLVICEDLWFADTVADSVHHGAQCILAPNASPFEYDKHEKRSQMLINLARNHKIPLIYCNLIGGQDDLVFDGGSLIADANGSIAHCAGFFKENITCTPIEIGQPIKSQTLAIPTIDARIYQALVCATRDYIIKNHFPGALIGVSGGIDSALTLAIAVDALGADKVHAVILPSRHTSQISLEEAYAVVKALGVSHELIDIEPIYSAFLQSLATRFAGKPVDTTEENLQARCRGTLMMAISNQTGKIVLTTGNRSELAVGYATLYGDMAGGFNVLKDIPKTRVYQLAHYRNSLAAAIPKRTITREPTAELAANQKDADTLPPYDILDKILEYHLDQAESIDEIVAHGLDRTLVERIAGLVARNEYKRRQAALGPRIHHKAFGRDRRYPVTCG